MKIDNIDIKEFGAYLVDNGYLDLLSYPPLKNVEYNDWAEYDGIDPDLSDPKVNAKEIDMNFCFRGDKDVDGFIELLTNGNKYHTFSFDSIGRDYNLRLTGASTNETGKIDFITFNFVEDNPIREYTYTPPTSSLFSTQQYRLDDTYLEDYGVKCLSGTLDSVMKPFDIKQNLVRDISTKNGTIFNGNLFKLKEKDVTLKCLLKGSTLEEMWNNYDALFYDLTKPDQRELYVSEASKIYPCFYKESKVTDFAPLHNWIEFDLTLTFTAAYVKESYILLSTEDSYLITTEDGTFIDVTN